MSNLALVVLSALLFIVPASAPAAWSKTLAAPFSGSSRDSVQNLVQGLINVARVTTAVTPYFGLANGTGGSNTTGSTNSSVLPANGGPPAVHRTEGGWSDIRSTVEPNITIAFRNLSGIRLLHHINVTVRYAYSGLLSYVAGQCPWVKSDKKSNWCDTDVASQFSLGADYMSRPNGRAGTRGYCISGCPNNSTGVGNDSSNVSGKLTSMKGSVASASINFSGSGTAVLTFSPTSPVSKSGNWDIDFALESDLDLVMECKEGAGGITGASASVTFAFSFSIVSVVES